MPTLPETLTLSNGPVVLRDWSEDDTVALRPVCGNPDVCRFTSVPWFYSDDAARTWVPRQRARREAGQAVALAIEADGVVGNVNLTTVDGPICDPGGDKSAHRPGFRGAAVLGYWLVPTARSRGYATVAARALCAWGFEMLGLERIELAILPENAASHRVAERLGARYEGLRRHSHEAEGRRWDMAIYCLRASDWVIDA